MSFRLRASIRLGPVGTVALGFLLGLLISLLYNMGSTAHGADCNVLHDADERHTCRALTQCLKSECEFIENADARQVCRVRVDMECKKGGR